MERLNKFIKTSILGGLLVLLPVVIVYMVYNWVFIKATDAIQPMTDFVGRMLPLPEFYLREMLADVLVFATLVFVCFLLGLFVKIGFGKFIHGFVEDRVLKNFPIYTIIKEVLVQFLGDKKSPLSEVVLCKPFAGGALMTGFVTDESENGFITTFVPTGPNPTSGLIFHLEEENVFRVELPVETAMKTIIAMGAGSAQLLMECNPQLEK